MGGLFAPKESSTEGDDKVNDDDEVTAPQDAPEPDTTSDTKMVVDDNENPF